MGPEEVQLLHVDGFRVVAASSRTAQRGGGTAILLKSEFKHSNVFDLTRYNQDGCIEISGTYLLGPKLYFCGV